MVRSCAGAARDPCRPARWASLSGPAATLAATLAVALLGLGGAGHASGHDAQPAAQAGVREVAGAPVAPSRLAGGTWTCPMHHDVVRKSPGACPICGMALVEVDSAGTGDHHGVHVDAGARERLGLRVAQPKLQPLVRDLAAYGTVAIDTSRQFSVASKVEGILRRLHAASVGQSVRAGDVLYEIESLDLLQMQREYIAFLREKDAMVAEMTRGEGHGRNKGMSAWDSEKLVTTTRERMRLRERLLYSDLGEDLLGEIDRTYTPHEVVAVRATRSGVVTEVLVHEGGVVRPMENIATIADLDRVSIEVPLYADQLPRVRSGDLATVHRPAPDRGELTGRLVIANSVVDEASRTVRGKILVDNPGARLRVGAYVDVTLHAEPHRALVVPRSAVLRTARGDWVMRALTDETFVPTRVEVGIESSDLSEIVAGLKVEDRIAVSGQFLLDSAAALGEGTHP